LQLVKLGFGNVQAVALLLKPEHSVTLLTSQELISWLKGVDLNLSKGAVSSSPSGEGHSLPLKPKFPTQRSPPIYLFFTTVLCCE